MNIKQRHVESTNGEYRLRLVKTIQVQIRKTNERARTIKKI